MRHTHHERNTNGQHARNTNGDTLRYLAWLLTFASIFPAFGCAASNVDDNKVNGGDNSADGSRVDGDTSVAPKIYLNKEGGAPTVSLDYGSADPSSTDSNSFDPKVTDATQADSDEHDIHTVRYTPLIQKIEVVNTHAQSASAQDTTQNTHTSDNAQNANTPSNAQNTRTLRHYRGMPLVVNFFAAWCPPCVREMPEFNFVFNKLKNELDGEVAFLGLSQDSDVEDALDLVTRTQVDYDIGWDPKAEVHKTTGSLAMPTTVFITPEGEVAEVFAGVLNREGMLERIAALRTGSR